jgi:CRISPR-associated protein Cmr6
MGAYLVPQDTEAILPQAFNRCDNLGLILDRYVTYGAAFNKTERRDNRDVNLRAEFVRNVCQRFAVRENNREWQAVLNAEYAQWQRVTRHAPVRFSMRAATRLIVGLGGKGVLEIGITLRHVSGLPVIPGSALKGAARAYALYTIAAEHFSGRTDLNALDDELGAGKHDNIPVARQFHRIFGGLPGADGDGAASGECVFYDAVVMGRSGLPGEGSLFEADVLTPHFPDYYRNEGGIAPSDDQNPIPVTFLTVAPKTRFAFAVGLRVGVAQTNETKELSRRAAQWLEGALIDLGIGSKTAAGYGAFADAKMIG